MSLRYRIFRALAQVSIKRPYLVLLCAVALSIASILYTKARLEFHTGQDDLITPNSRASRDYLDYTSEFPDLDGLVVVVRAAPDPARAERFADALAARLNADHANVKTVFYKIDAGAFADRAMLYMPAADLDALAQKLRAAFPMLGGYAADPSLAGFFAIVNAGIDRQVRAQMPREMQSRLQGKVPSNLSGDLRNRMRAPAAASQDSLRGASTAPPPAPGPSDSGAFDTGAIDTVLNGMLADADSAKYVSPWQSMMQAGGQDSVQGHGYLVSDNGKYLLLQVAPGDGVKDGPDPTEAIESDLNAVRAAFPGVMAGMTGGPALAHAEETTTAHDIALASMIAIGSNVLPLAIPFTAVVEPLFAVLALLAGVAWSFGFTTLAIGHLNLLSAVFTSVLAGIGINFPIHLMARYDEGRRQGATSAEAVELAVVNTGTGVFASACIMALAFLTPVFTDFRGIAELGIVSAAGLFLCLISALLVFPALVVLRDRYRPRARGPNWRRRRAPRSLKPLPPPGIDRRGRGGGNARRAATTGRVSFDQNLLKLQAEQTRRSSSKTSCSRIRDARRGSRFRWRPRLKRARRVRRPFASCRGLRRRDHLDLHPRRPGGQAQDLAWAERNARADQDGAAATSGRPDPPRARARPVGRPPER